MFRNIIFVLMYHRDKVLKIKHLKNEHSSFYVQNVPLCNILFSPNCLLNCENCKRNEN
jgi:hypothetical protein